MLATDIPFNSGSGNDNGNDNGNGNDSKQIFSRSASENVRTSEPSAYFATLMLHYILSVVVVSFSFPILLHYSACFATFYFLSMFVKCSYL